MRLFELNIDKEEDKESILKIGIALSSPIRVAILKQVNERGKTLSELAKLNYVSFSSIVFHTKLLEEANLIRIKTIKVNNVYSKYVIKGCISINIHFNDVSFNTTETEKIEESMPVGCYTNANFGQNNGFVINGIFHSFYENTPFLNDRFKADLIYSSNGFVEYSFDNSKIKDKNVEEIMFSLEICSEVPYYNNNFESLIGFSINDIEVIDFISPGDFGGRRGKFSPSNSSLNATQYGQLKTIIINKNGVYLDGILLNENIKVNDLKLNDNNHILFKITSKKHNDSFGGFNIFGKNYGDYPQDILMTISYEK